MRLSSGKVNELSKVILSALLEDDSVEFYEENNDIRLEVVNLFNEELSIDEAIDKRVRYIISTYSDTIREGTSAWELLYQKHYREEEKKRRGI